MFKLLLGTTAVNQRGLRKKLASLEADMKVRVMISELTGFYQS